MKFGSLALFLAGSALVGCAHGTLGGDDGDGDNGGDDDDGGGDGGGDDNDSRPGEVPDPIAQSGVVYAGHYASTDLRRIRIDGGKAVPLAPFDLGDLTHDLVLDSVHDVLVAVSDVARKVSLYQLRRPSGPEADVPAPVALGSIEFDDPPLLAAVDPYGERLYVFTMAAARGSVPEMKIHPFDTSDPADPTALPGGPWTIPVTTSFALDPARRVLFAVGLADDTLYGWDVTDEGLVPLPGDPIDLVALFPEDSASSFQARSLTVDMHRHRLYAARSQGALSEFIAFEYDGAVPATSARYGELAGLGDLTPIADPFDVSRPPDEVPNLLGIHALALDPLTGALFASADAWSGTAATAIVAAVPTTLEVLAPGCNAFEGFGCWLRTHIDGASGAHVRTEGAMCVDATHRVVVASSVASNEDDPGRLHAFGYNDSLAMEVLLPETGGDLPASASPVALVCH